MVKSVDQDLLNKFFYDDYYKIHLKFHVALFKGYKLSYNREPFIIHYTGKIKPKYFICPHPLRDRYIFYINQIPFKGNYEKFTIKKWFQRNIFLFLRFIKHSFVGRAIFH